MSIFRKFKRALRGEVSPHKALLEVGRRSYSAISRRKERARLEQQAKQPARLTPEFARLSSSGLLSHFRERDPNFFPGFEPSPLLGILPVEPPADTAALAAAAEQIVTSHSWPLLGLGEHLFVDWHRDPLSGFDWPLDFYSELNLHRGDGSDVRVVWELNRLSHLLTLACAYSLNHDQRLSAEFFRGVESWDSRNPIGFGVNWNCAMEVALRAMNLVGAFSVFRRAPDLDAERLGRLLRIFDQHGSFIREHLEFSYVATSNHYLSNVAGLLWLGVLLPELTEAKAWRDFGLRELQREMDKQVLPDGADCESSTGYHRLVLELFLYSFLQCRLNGIEIEGRYWQKLHQMFRYLRSYLRPDGAAPLLGDSDGGRVLPIYHHRGNDHGYLLSIGAVLFDDPQLKDDNLGASPELYWLLGERAFQVYEGLAADTDGTSSQYFPDAGVCVLREGNDYLLLNASGVGLNGRGSHGHNDALSIEVSACGRAFIVDPGTFVYTADLQQRHLFRSTAYHSTVQIDGVEQNQTSKSTPFVIGDEAKPKLVTWFDDALKNGVSADHYGYRRLPQPVTHRRKATFYKEARLWLVEDEFFGSGEHKFTTRFHFDSGLEVTTDNERVRGWDPASGHQLLICPLDLGDAPDLEFQYTSKDYAQKMESTSACWTIHRSVPAKLRWAIIPVCANDDENQRLQVITELGNLSI
jgi:hypothetical protein